MCPLRDRPRMPDHAQSQSEPTAPSDADSRRALMAAFVAAGEFERRRVAEAIHDDSIQVISAMGMRLQMLRRSLDDAGQLALLDDAEPTVQHSIRRLRALVFELQPPGLEEEGVAVALAIALEAASRDGGPRRIGSTTVGARNPTPRRGPSSSASPRRRSPTCASTPRRRRRR